MFIFKILIVSTVLIIVSGQSYGDGESKGKSRASPASRARNGPKTKPVESYSNDGDSSSNRGPIVQSTADSSSFSPNRGSSQASVESSGFNGDDGQFDISRNRLPGEVIHAAIKTKHTFETKPVDIPFEDQEPQIVEIDGGALPLEIHFKSSSSRITVKQSHQLGDTGKVERTESEEEPTKLIHEVRKPIIQEVREIITPYRKVIQEIQPVMEEIHTIVSKGQARRQGSSGRNKGGDSGRDKGSGGQQVDISNDVVYGPSPAPSPPSDNYDESGPSSSDDRRTPIKG